MDQYADASPEQILSPGEVPRGFCYQAVANR